MSICQSEKFAHEEKCISRQMSLFILKIILFYSRLLKIRSHWKRSFFIKFHYYFKNYIIVNCLTYIKLKLKFNQILMLYQIVKANIYYGAKYGLIDSFYSELICTGISVICYLKTVFSKFIQNH